jgi:hypothetical protein
MDWNKVNVSEWSDTFTYGVLFQWASTMKIQLIKLVWYKAGMIINILLNVP